MAKKAYDVASQNAAALGMSVSALVTLRIMQVELPPFVPDLTPEPPKPVAPPPPPRTFTEAEALALSAEEKAKLTPEERQAVLEALWSYD